MKSITLQEKIESLLLLHYGVLPDTPTAALVAKDIVALIGREQTLDDRYDRESHDDGRAENCGCECHATFTYKSHGKCCFILKPVIQHKSPAESEADAGHPPTKTSSIPPTEDSKKEYRANFLWPNKSGSIEDAGYEFANAQTKEYQKAWWAILITRIKDKYL